MAVAPPDGRVSANASPWAQVWINGNLVGETPIANLPLAVGEHQITFRHPQLGEQTQKVVVRSSALTRVSATFAR
jgi:PEGA domain-containing protein